MQNVVKKRNSLIWGVIALIIGVLVMFNPGTSIEILVYIIGFGLLVTGIVQLLTFIATRKRLNMSWWSIPLGAVLSVVLGAMLVSSPLTFMVFIMYVIGAILIALSVMQLYSLTLLKRSGAVVKGGFFMFPILLLLSGVVCMAFPIATNAWIVIFAGAWIVAYGVAEIAAHFAIGTPKEDTPKEESGDKYPDMP